MRFLGRHLQSLYQHEGKSSCASEAEAKAEAEADAGPSTATLTATTQHPAEDSLMIDNRSAKSATLRSLTPEEIERYENIHVVWVYPLVHRPVDGTTSDQWYCTHVDTIGYLAPPSSVYHDPALAHTKGYKIERALVDMTADLPWCDELSDHSNSSLRKELLTFDGSNLDGPLPIEFLDLYETKASAITRPFGVELKILPHDIALEERDAWDKREGEKSSKKKKCTVHDFEAKRIWKTYV